MLLAIRQRLSAEIICLAALGLVVLGVSVFECIWAFSVPMAGRTNLAKVHATWSAPVSPAWVSNPSRAETRLDTPVLADTSSDPPDQTVAAPQSEPDAAPTTIRPAALPKLAPLVAPPLPPVRPVETASLENPPVPMSRREAEGVKSTFDKMLHANPNSGSALASLLPDSSFAELSTRYGQFTAVYDLSAHTVYLPNGVRLEAHSGLGDRLDNPSYVDEPDRGATPPHLYELTARESLFHGVQALRLNPVGGAGEIFGRAGLLAHTYMLGLNGDSNGCVSFKDYEAFLQAFQAGIVKRLAVVARLY